jgi:tetratricopeptide (TPR) repeat protein
VAVPVTVVSELLGEIVQRFSDPTTPVGQSELRSMLRRLRSAQRDVNPDDLAPLFDTIGLVCVRLRDFGTALDAHRNAARYDKFDAAYPNNIAACLIELGQLPQALAALRDASARPLKRPGIDLCILANTAEIEHRLGNHDAARRAFDEALRSVDPKRPIDLINAASTAAVLGAEEDAVELFARCLAVTRGVDMGNIPALDFVMAHPDAQKIAGDKSPQLGAALKSVAARNVAEVPPEHQVSAQVTLPPAALSA